ncbi:hypothetical protein DPMN_079065 [Dreissena polymorpha]|uniref:Uncharacterized protein n=1 Tax=Dreissena polymorpha TaxID=45954 RepID=A0A9D4BI24_DREPO|nr:hypothetical protein DPMN_079065 [Dreissena polymorpha]
MCILQQYGTLHSWSYLIYGSLKSINAARIDMGLATVSSSKRPCGGLASIFLRVMGHILTVMSQCEVPSKIGSKE